MGKFVSSGVATTAKHGIAVREVTKTPDDVAMMPPGTRIFALANKLSGKPSNGNSAPKLNQPWSRATGRAGVREASDRPSAPGSADSCGLGSERYDQQRTFAFEAVRQIILDLIYKAVEAKVGRANLVRQPPSP
ncbi:hypothetical protein M1D34_27520 (plasmid) [Ensifer sp. D2-11]